MSMAHRLLLLLSVLLLSSLACLAQTPPKDSSASISGRITVGGKGVAGITIALTSSSSMFDNRTVAKAVTDEDGNYRLAGLAAGRYTIIPLAKSFVVGGAGSPEQPGTTINVDQGEAITKMDFTLMRGGVITGRITDAEGRPIIGERVNVTTEVTPVIHQISMFDGPRNKTDDRGIYRIYGLAPGSYKISVGQAASSASVSVMGMGGSQYVKTFYPGVQDETKATPVEVSEGAEVAHIDINLGKPPSGFVVSGRAVNADNGQPVPNVYIGYSTLNTENQQMGQMAFTGNQTDANGKFRLEGLQPGHYAVYTVAIAQDNSSYSEPAMFDVSDGDVTGIEIKVRRGASIRGVAVLENNSDPAAAALLQTITLYAYIEEKGGTAPSFSRGQIGSDGSFSFSGLAPGKARIGVQGFPVPPKGLSLVRTELDGLEQQEGIELAAGAQVTGVRLVFAYGTGTVRGTVKVEGGVLPAGTILQLFLPVAGDTRQFRRNVEIDARGHFVAEDLPPGPYDLILRAVTADQKQSPAFKPLKRTITVANGAEIQADLVFDLAVQKAGP